MATVMSGELRTQVEHRTALPAHQPGINEALVDQVDVGDRVIPRAVLGAGWQFSIHDPIVTRNHRSCAHTHEGVVLAGTSRIFGADGSEVTLHPGDVYVVAGSHDWRVVGDDPVVVLGFGSATPACVTAAPGRADLRSRSGRSQSSKL